MELDFAGDLRWWQGLCLALLVTWAMWHLYRLETRSGRSRWAGLLLPVLRCMVIFLLIMCLTGPVVLRRYQEGRVGRVFVFVDGSKSMTLHDKQVDSGRKLLLAISEGLLPPGIVDTSLNDAAEKLQKARLLVGDSLPWGRSSEATKSLRAIVRGFAEYIQSTAGIISRLDPEFLPVSGPQKGSVSVEYFDNIPGSTLRELLNSPQYKKGPSRRGELKLLEGISNRGENYGSRIRGFLYPPETGDYTFWISGDDESSLFLSNDETEKKGRVIASVKNYTARREWEQTSTQKSIPIFLEKGKKYFLEVLHKQGSGEDHVAVGWKTPGGILQRPVPGLYVSPYTGKKLFGAEALKKLSSDFKRDLLGPANELVSESGSKNDTFLRGQLERLSLLCMVWMNKFKAAFTLYAVSLLGSGNEKIKIAAGKFDALPRWKRAQAILIDPRSGLLERLQDTHKLQVIELNGGNAQLLYQAFGKKKLPGSLGLVCEADVTDLCTGIKNYMAAAVEKNEQSAILLFSDGRHNTGPSPLKMAKVSGGRKIPVFTVGLGSVVQPEDLSVVDVEAPQSVYVDNRISGGIVVSDHMTPGRDFELEILDGDTQVWKKDLKTKGSGSRRIEFDFPVKDIVERRKKEMNRNVHVLSLPVTLTASIKPLPGENKTGNNSAYLSFRAVVYGKKILLIDGRPRWEWRYIHNLFDRDKQWEITALIAYGPGEWKAGEGTGQFPEDLEALYSYSLIIFGDIPRRVFTNEQMEWIRDFVEKRCGGIIFIDGERGNLSGYQETPLASLLPVKKKTGPDGFYPRNIQLTDAGKKIAALRLVKDAKQNESLWKELPPPHWTALNSALEGTETYAEAVSADRSVPLLVFRRFGGGKTFYSAFDESWRFRYMVADKYHQQYWNNLVNWLTEPPFAIQDRFVSLDVGPTVYENGQPVQIRVRLRNRNGMPLVGAKATAVLYKKKPGKKLDKKPGEKPGEKLLFVPLQGDEKNSGLYRGSISDLKPGEYETRVRVEGFSELELKARTSFKVKPPFSREFSELTCNEQLLRSMAVDSGGKYLAEENAGELADLLKPLSEGKIIVKETHLNQSFWLFVPIILLLTVEWLVRKRNGLL